MRSRIGSPDAEGRALVLVHGAGGTHAIWSEVVGELRASGIPVLAVDLRGHGANPGPALQDVREHAGQMEILLREAGVREYVVAGHSLGGAVALSLVARRAEGARGLGAVSTGARLSVDVRILKGVHSDFAATVERIARYVFAKGTEAGMVEGTAEMMRRAGPDTLYADFAACAAYGLAEEELRGIRVPTEIVCGEADVMTPPALSEELAAGIPGARLTLIPNCGHMPLVEAPRELSAALAALWRRAFG